MVDLPQVVTQFPYYLKARGNHNPINKNDSPFMFAFDTKLHYFKWLKQSGFEDRHKAFGQHMSFKDMGRKWYDPTMTNVPEILDYPSDPNAALMVDLGGNIGHDLIRFYQQFPHIPGCLILQDLPSQLERIDKASFPSSIQVMSHDFFTPQPVQGAKAYYLHMILHDWPDQECVKILNNIKPVMKKGHSKILLNEIIIPDRKANWYCTSLDMVMMMTHAAQERTETDWRDLVQKAGFKVSKIWDCGGAPQKIIEIELG